jgi:purine-binding chemotaxis protein CheW
MVQLDVPHSGVAIAGSTQYLTFGLGAEEYAIDILGVQEIKGYSLITPIPHAPPHIKGVINLRGTVVPVVGLRERFGMPAVEYDKFTVIIVVMVGTRVVGVVVDAVTDVLSLTRNDLQPPPELGAAVDTSFIRGIAKTAERLVIVLDAEAALSDALEASIDAPRAERAGT